MLVIITITNIIISSIINGKDKDRKHWQQRLEKGGSSKHKPENVEWHKSIMNRKRKNLKSRRTVRIKSLSILIFKNKTILIT